MATLYKPKKLLSVKEGAAIFDSTLKLLNSAGFQEQYVLGIHKKINKRFLIKSDYRTSVENVVLEGDNKCKFKKSSTFRGQKGFIRKEVLSMLWIDGDSRFIDMESCGLTDDEIWALYEAAYCTGEDLVEFFLDPKNNTSVGDKLLIARVIVQRAFSSTLYLIGMGICHRDNKADNILFDENGQSKQNDFDLATKLKNLYDSVSNRGHTGYLPVLLEGEKPTIFSKDVPQLGGMGLEMMEQWDCNKDPEEMEAIIWTRLSRGLFSVEVAEFIEFCMACRKVNDQKALDHVMNKYRKFIIPDPKLESRFVDVLFPAFKESAITRLVIPFATSNQILDETPFLYDYVSRLPQGHTVEKLFKDISSGKSRGKGKDKAEFDRIIAKINEARVSPVKRRLKAEKTMGSPTKEEMLEVSKNIKRLDIQTKSEDEHEDSDTDFDATSDRASEASDSSSDLLSSSDVDFDPFDVEDDEEDGLHEASRLRQPLFRFTKARFEREAVMATVPKKTTMTGARVDNDGFAVPAPKTPFKHAKVAAQPGLPLNSPQASSPRRSQSPAVASPKPLRSGFDHSSVLESVNTSSSESTATRVSLKFNEIPTLAQKYYAEVIQFMISGDQRTKEPWFDALAICENPTCRKVLLLPKNENAGRTRHKEVNDYLRRTRRTDEDSAGATLSSLFSAVSSFANRTCGRGKKCNNHMLPELEM